MGDPEDCIVDLGRRFGILVAVLAGMIVIKLLVSNGLSPQLIGKNKYLSGAISDHDKAEEAHPVAILFSVVFFGAIWGTVGMFISVPVVAVVRMAINIVRLREEQ